VGLIRGIGRALGWASRRLAMRSRWLARRLWLIAAADVVLTTRRHWKRLDPDEQDKLVALARKSRGRSSRLNAAERGEAGELLDKLGYVELIGGIAAIVLPIAPLSRLLTRLVTRRRGRGQSPRPDARG
jgi:hypothetical protein